MENMGGTGDYITAVLPIDFLLIPDIKWVWHGCDRDAYPEGFGSQRPHNFNWYTCSLRSRLQTVSKCSHAPGTMPLTLVTYDSMSRKVFVQYDSICEDDEMKTLIRTGCTEDLTAIAKHCRDGMDSCHDSRMYIIGIAPSNGT